MKEYKTDPSLSPGLTKLLSNSTLATVYHIIRDQILLFFYASLWRQGHPTHVAAPIRVSKLVNLFK